MHSWAMIANIRNEVVKDSRVQRIVKEVKRTTSLYLQRSKIFGYRYFEDDLLSDIELEIYNYESYCVAIGKQPDLSIGAYVNSAKQGACNYSQMCQAHKRIINHIALPLYDCIDPNSPFADTVDLLASISQSIGQEVADLAKTVLLGGSLNRDELAKLRQHKDEIKVLMRA